VRVRYGTVRSRAGSGIRAFLYVPGAAPLFGANRIQPPQSVHLRIDPEELVPAAWHGLMGEAVPGEAIGAFVRSVCPGAPVPRLSAELCHLGGEFARPGPATARCRRSTLSTCSTLPA
jgi:hypothetical protein